MASLNDLIHQPVRLRIMAALVAISKSDQVEFTYIRDLFNLSDGNLGAHLRKLEDAGYVELKKTFVARKPCTYISATSQGRQAFDDHVAALEAIVYAGEDDKERGV